MAPGAGIGEASSFYGAGVVTLGEGVVVGPHCMFITSSHPVPEPGRKPHDTEELVADIVVEDYVAMGARVTILPGVTIGASAAVAASSVVAHDVAPGALVGGHPARAIPFKQKRYKR
jgi:acetyltransferase-like isoleucine patch superfamily enzyme